MKIAISTALALLVACVVMAYINMKNSEINNPQALEIERLKKREAQLVAALNNVTISNQNTSQPLHSPTSLEKMAAQQSQLNELERVRAEIAELKESQNDIEEKAAVIAEAAETPPVQTVNKKAQRRATLIRSALVMARVSAYSSDAQMAEIKIENVGLVNTGDILGIRRNSGIIGRVTVGTMERDQGIADPVPSSFLGGGIDIKPGDELILPPDL